jgi:hypothetical protein
LSFPYLRFNRRRLRWFREVHALHPGSHFCEVPVVEHDPSEDEFRFFRAAPMFPP